MLTAEALCGGRGDRLLFAGLDLEAGPGQALHITGANGSGKTTLLRMLAGLMPVMAGRIWWNDQLLSNTAQTYGRQMAWLGHRNGLKAELTVVENLVSAGQLRQQPVTAADTRSTLQALALEQQVDMPVALLSQGQQRRVALARVLISGAVLWLLDEPTTALDRAGVDHFGRCCERHLDSGGMLVFANHQPLERIAARVRTLALQRFAVTLRHEQDLCWPSLAI